MIPLMSEPSDCNSFLLPPIDIDLDYQGIIIKLKDLKLEGGDPIEDMYNLAEQADLLIDPMLLVKVTGFFHKMHWELGKGYCVLKELLTILGTNILLFNH
ncbi:hypothetical protein H0H87_010807 [Tephrocybe sp. NHM501043]|nr:hypothetical protein H0H87_010807 [Tephrocybe sp. NHM501043]